MLFPQLKAHLRLPKTRNSHFHSGIYYDIALFVYYPTASLRMPPFLPRKSKKEEQPKVVRKWGEKPNTTPKRTVERERGINKGETAFRTSRFPLISTGC
jgi:hypothetical protein